MTPLIVAACVLTIAALVFWAERSHNRQRNFRRRLEQLKEGLAALQAPRPEAGWVEPAPVPDLEDVIYAQLMETSRSLEEGVVRFRRKETCKQRKKPIVFYNVSLPFNGRRYDTYFCTEHALNTTSPHTPYWERACRRLAKQIADKQREGAKG